MPERTIGSDRPPISRDGGTIVGISRGTLSGVGITRGASGRQIATPEQTAAYNAQVPPSQSAIDAINAMIRQNAPQYIAVPWNAAYNPGNQAGVVSPSVPQGTFYGTGNPFLVLSDVMRNLFGNDGDVGRQRDTGQALVPVTSTSGGSNTLLILLFVVGIAGIGYYLYKKRQTQ